LPGGEKKFGVRYDPVSGNISSSRTRFCRSMQGRSSRAISSATRRPFSAR